MRRPSDLLALLRLLPSPWLSTFVWKLAREVGLDADRSASAAQHARGERDEARRLLEKVSMTRDANAVSAREAAARVVDLTDELRLLTREAADLRADVEKVVDQRRAADRACVESQEALAAMTAERDEALRCWTVSGKKLREAAKERDDLRADVQRLTSELAKGREPEPGQP